MRRLLFIILLALGFGISSLAQDSFVSRKEMTRQTEKQWKRDLNLSSKQYQSLKIINRESSKKTREIRLNTALDYEARNRQLQLLEQKRRKTLNTLLNEDQRRKLARMRGDRRG